MRAAGQRRWAAAELPAASRVKYDARLKRQYKLSYRRVQDVLTWIEMERMLSASQRKQRRRASKGAGPAVQGGGGGPP